MPKNLWWIILLLVYGSGFVLHSVFDGRGGDGDAAIAWRAARKLPASHQLREDDLEPPEAWAQRLQLPDRTDLIGRHLKTAKDPKARVTSSDVTETPQLTTAAGHRLIVVPLDGQASLVRLLEPEAEVLACYVPAVEKGETATAQCLDPVSVVAIHGKTSSDDPSWVALSVPQEKVQDAIQFLAAKDRTLVLAPPETKKAVDEGG